MSEHTTILTYPTHAQIDVLNPQPTQIHIIDVAHALSRECRYAGFTEHPWTVAQHCIAGAMLLSGGTERALQSLPNVGAAPIQLRVEAFRFLLHDLPEAYLKDLPGPLKRELPEYKAIEAKWDRAVAVRFGLVVGTPVVKAVDKLIYRAEDATIRGHERHQSADGVLGSFARGIVEGLYYKYIDTHGNLDSVRIKQRFLQVFAELAYPEADAPVRLDAST